MPIKPENKARYPANWKEIRQAILERAQHQCEKCKAPNGARIARGAGKCEGSYITEDGYVSDAETGESLGRARHSEFEARGDWITVVLTIAHLDHVPENCDPSNLRAWCQRCHLRYDAEHHAINARETRRARKAIGDLFGAPTDTEAK